VTTYWVRLGDWHRYYYDGTEQVRKASEIIVHPQYNYPVLYNNDIALIKLERPVVLNSHVNTICLPQPGVSVPLNSACYITGERGLWSMTSLKTSLIFQERNMRSLYVGYYLCH